jgi:hypothetical protein
MNLAELFDYTDDGSATKYRKHLDEVIKDHLLFSNVSFYEKKVQSGEIDLDK